MEKDVLIDSQAVGAATAALIEKVGFKTFMSIAVMRPKGLAGEVDGITANGAEKYIEEAKILAKLGSFYTTTELIEKRKKLQRLTTSSPLLDSLFGGGGLETTSISEFYGEFGSGKTQICFQLAVNATMPIADGGLDGHVIVIDTENTFRPIRIEQIATAHGLDVDEVNSKIHVARAFNSAHQMLLLTDKADELAKQVPVKLLIVDSLVSLFRSEYIGRGNLADRQGLLNTHMHDILKFTDAHNAVAAVTNQVLTNPGQMFGDPTKPVGGNIIGHNSTYRVFLRKGKGGKRVARMVDSPETPDSEVILSIGEEGCRDG